MLVLDTNIVSRIMRRDPAIREHLKLVRPRDILIPTPVMAEISYGLARLGNTKRARNLGREYERLRELVVGLDWDESAAEHFGRIKASLQTGEDCIEDFNIAIAASALSIDADLVTANVRHFEGIEGLRLEQWD